MSRLSKKALDEFKQIFLKTRGAELGDGEADRMGWYLLELAALTLKPIEKDEPP